MITMLRVLGEADAERTTHLINVGAAEPATIEMVRARLRGDGRTEREVRRHGAFDGDRQVGYGHAVREKWSPDGLYWLHLAVDPTLRRQGIGSQLYAALLDYVRGYGATTLRGEVRDSEPEMLAFAERQGFGIDRHLFESTLDLTDFDAERFTKSVERVRGQGIHFVTMAEVGDTAEARYRLYELERTVARDIPGGSESSTRPYEAFLKEICDSPGYLPDGQVLAVDGEVWVGLSSLLSTSTSGGFYNAITGVLPAYRGHGIALALKLLTIEAALRHGATYLRTNNDSENTPMLAVNRRLGYHPAPGYYRLIATIAPRD